MKILRYRTSRGLLEKSGGFLAQNPAENCLILGLLESGKATQLPARTLLCATEEDGQITGVSVLARKLILSRMSPVALARFIEELRVLRVRFKAIHGPAETTRLFAELWRERTRQELRPGLHLRLYRLEKLIPPSPPPGTLEPASSDDLSLLARWGAEFIREANVGEADPRQLMRTYIREKRLFVWRLDAKIVSMAGFGGETRDMARVSLVYTPPDLRGQGYASACVAGVSSFLLSRPKRLCLLFADLANPTSNSVYRKLGYVPVCDVQEFHV